MRKFFRNYKDILLHGKTKDKVIGWAIIVLIAWIVGSAAFNFLSPGKEQYVPTSDFVYQLQNGNVEEMHISNADGTVSGTFKEPTENGIKNFSSHVPERSETFTQQYLNTGEIKWDYSKSPEWVSTIANLFFMVLQIGLLVGAMMWLMSKMSGDGSMFPFGSEDASRWEPENTNVTFDDIAGVPEAIEEVQEILTFLREPEKYEEAGAEIPKGVLMAGPSGVGKTLLGKILANEADAAFYSCNGSDFVKMYVGAGPKAIRELFAEARSNAPRKAIIFIDEIDSIAQARSSSGDSGAEKEYAASVNSLLSELDGATHDNSNILVIGATNRPDSLDSALTRKGRFDRIIQIDNPAKEGRVEILQHYAQGRPFAEPVDFNKLATHTYGFSGADLKNVMNEASTLAARRAVQAGEEHPAITKEDIDEGIARTISGPAMKSRKMNDEEKRQVAYHEAGHAVVQYLIPECDPVQKISIVSRNIQGVGAAMGYVQSYSEEDSYVTTSSQLHAELAALMGGRCSEKMHCGIESAGACDDLRKASSIAYDMVNKYAFESPQGDQLSWRVEVDGKRMSSAQERLQRNDEQIDAILERAYDTARRILSSHRAQVEKIVEVLLENETIDSEQIQEIMKDQRTPFAQDQSSNQATPSQQAETAQYEMFDGTIVIKAAETSDIEPAVNEPVGEEA